MLYNFGITIKKFIGTNHVTKTISLALIPVSSDDVIRLFETENYVAAQAALGTWETKPYTQKIALLNDILAVLNRADDWLGTTVRFINTKGFPKFFKGFLHAQIVKKCKDYHDIHQIFPAGFTIAKVEVHARLAIIYEPNNEFDYKTNLFIAEQLFEVEDYRSSLIYYLALNETENTYDKIFDLLRVGDCHINLDDETAALEAFRSAIKLFKTELHINDRLNLELRHEIASAAEYVANGFMKTNLAKGLYYFNIAVDLNYAHALYALGCRYATGDDVPKNIPKAIDLLKKAVAKDHRDSMVYLFRLLRDNQLPMVDLVEKMKHIQHDAKIYHLLGIYYFNHAKQLKPRALDKSKPFYSESHRLAVHYYHAAGKMNLGASMFNLGVIYEYGYGTKIDIVKAEKYYTEATVHHYKKAYHNLAALYQRKLIQSQDDRDQQQLKPLTESMLTYLSKSDNTVTVDSNKSIAELVRELTAIKLEVRDQCVSINKNIIKIFRDPTLRIRHKCEFILEYDVSNMDLVNAITIIHKFGILFEKIHDRSIFDYLPKIMTLLDVVKSNLDLATLSVMQVTNLIEGLSKLYLQKHAEGVYDILDKLITLFLEKIASYAVVSRLTIFFALIRLDSRAGFFSSDIIARILSTIDMDKTVLNTQDFTNLFYASAVLDAHKSLPDLGFIKSMLTYAIELFQTDGGASLSHSATQQVYLALLHFSVKYPEQTPAATARCLQEYQEYLLNNPEKSPGTRLQNEIIQQISPYFIHCKKEHMLNCLPVDALIETENDAFILQADGPAHYLHAENDEPEFTLKCLFRNRIHLMSHPFISVTYVEWDKLQASGVTPNYWSFFHAKLATIGKTMPNEKWQMVNSVKTPLFFSKKTFVASTSIADPLIRRPK